MAKVKEDISRVRILVDGKQSINELGKLEMEAKEFKQSLAQITEEQKKFEKEAQKLDKARERYDKLVAKAKELEAANKQGTATYTRTQASITKVTAEIQKAQQASVSLKDAQARYNQESAKLTATQSKIKALRNELGLAGMTMRQLRQYQRDLKTEIDRGATRGTAEYRRLRDELLQVNSAIRTQRAELNGTQGFFANMGKSLKGFGVMALGAFGITAGLQGLRMVMGPLISKNAEFSDSLSDVQKTTNLTDMELEKLTKNLKNFNTRTPRAELLGLAEIAGRLGIKGVKDIEGFVRAADMINVSLGDVLGDPEEVMRDLGKLTDTFGVKDAYGIEDSLLRLGSAINELGMASTANEGYMVDFAKRLGGVAPLAKISIQNILGLGATLDSLGQTSEVSSTALSKLFLKMASNADTYAKYAKMEVADFVKLLNEDANEAFIRSLEGVKDNSQGITELADTLGDLGEHGGRVVGVLGTLANNTQKLRDQQKLANEAFAEGTSVIDEFAIKNENLAANLAKIQNWLSEMFVNSFIMKGIDTFAAKWADWTMGVDEATEAFKQQEKEVKALEKEIPGLMDRYDKLSTATNLSAEEQEELKTVITRIGEIVPTAITEFDKYGNAMSINAGKVNEFTEAQREALKIMNADAINENVEHLSRLERQINSIRGQLTIRDEEGDIFKRIDMGRGVYANVKLTADEIRKLQDELTTLEQKSEGYKLIIDNLSGNPQQPDGTAVTPTQSGGGTPDPVVDPEAAKKAEAEYKKLVEEFKKYQKEIADLEEQQRISLLDRDSQEIAKLEAKYEPLLAKAREYHEKKLITDKEFAEMENSLLDLQNQERDALIKAHSDKIKEDRQKVVDEMAMLQLTDEERELEKIRSHYDKLLEEARKYGLETVALEKARDAALDEVKSERRKKEQDDITKGYDELIRMAQQGQMPVLEIEKAKQQALLDLASGYGAEKLAKEIALSKESLQNDITIAQAKEEIQRNLSATIGHTIDFIGNKSGELTAFQKILTLGQIAIDTASALSKIVPLAAEAAAGTGPAAPFVFGGYIASMAATVFGAIAKAKNALSGANTPKWSGSSGDGGGSPRDRNRPETPGPVASYYKGGDTSDTGLGFGDRYGEFAGYVHKDEYVVPSFIRSHPYVADVLPAIEAIRKEKIRGFYKGGETSKPSKPSIVPSHGADPEMIALLKSIDQKLNGLPTRIKAYLVDSELEEFREKRDMLKKKYVK